MTKLNNKYYIINENESEQTLIKRAYYCNLSSYLRYSSILKDIFRIIKNDETLKNYYIYYNKNTYYFTITEEQQPEQDDVFLYSFIKIEDLKKIALYYSKLIVLGEGNDILLPDKVKYRIREAFMNNINYDYILNNVQPYLFKITYNTEVAYNGYNKYKSYVECSKLNIYRYPNINKHHNSYSLETSVVDTIENAITYTRDYDLKQSLILDMVKLYFSLSFIEHSKYCKEIMPNYYQALIYLL